VLSALQRGAHRDPEWTRGECRRRAADDLHESSAQEIDEEDYNVNARRGPHTAPWTARLHGRFKEVNFPSAHHPAARRVYYPGAVP